MYRRSVGFTYTLLILDISFVDLIDLEVTLKLDRSPPRPPWTLTSFALDDCTVMKFGDAELSTKVATTVDHDSLSQAVPAAQGRAGSGAGEIWVISRASLAMWCVYILLQIERYLLTDTPLLLWPCSDDP